MKSLLNIVLHRNFILVLAVFMGLFLGDYATYIKGATLYILGLTMVFSMTGISTKSIIPSKKMINPFIVGTFLNYFIFGTVILVLAWFLMPTKELFMGFVVIVAAPPGVAVIPFTGILKGDIEYSIFGVFGAFLASIVIAPLLVSTFSDGSISSFDLFVLMIQMVLIPLVLSRILLLNSIFKVVSKIRGKVVDWGFAVLIFLAVGMNRDVFFSDSRVLLLIAIVLLSATFVIGSIYEFLIKRTNIEKKRVVSQVLLLTIKSSGFSVVTALTLFGKESAIPSAVLAVIVLLYLLFLSIKMELKKD
jgi:bile acid:Na+ symporter, BASS family